MWNLLAKMRKVRENACMLGFRGEWRVRCVAPDGRVKWDERIENLIVDAGINAILDTALGGDSQIATWYIGLKDTGSVAAGDTLASHAGWSEITGYSGDRKAWTPGAASSKSITNGTEVDFTLNATDTIYGIFLCSVSTGTSGTLLAAGDFSSSKTGDSGDILKVTYTVTGSSS